MHTPRGYACDQHTLESKVDAYTTHTMLAPRTRGQRIEALLERARAAAGRISCEKSRGLDRATANAAKIREQGCASGQIEVVRGAQ